MRNPNLPALNGPVLVTGGAGFIGSHLVDALLAAGHRVRVLDDLSTGRRENLDPRAELVVGDVAAPGDVAAAVAGTSGVFHLAAIASVARCNEDWWASHRVNVGGTVAVLEAARGPAGSGPGRHPIPVVYASSAAVYGDTGAAVAREDRAPAPLSAYGADKLGSELHARAGARVHGVPTLGLRFFNVYGPRQDPASPYSGVISIFARRIGAGLPVTLHGDGGQMRDFVEVADVVAHLRAAMRRLWMGNTGFGNTGVGSTGVGRVADGPVVNVCTGRVVAVRDLALLLERLHGVPPRIEFGPARPGDIRYSHGCAELAAATLDLRATVTLETGLARLLAATQPVPAT